MIDKSYNHPVLRAYQVEKIKAAISEHRYNESLHYADKTNVSVITQKDPNVKPFYHPLVLDEYNIILDGRGYTRPGRNGDSAKILNQTEYDFNVSRAQLELAWLGDGRFGLTNIAGIPANFYAKWISETIARVYNLDPENQMRLSLIAAWYFYCQFRPSEEFDESDHPRLISFISRATSISVVRINEIIKELYYIEDIGQFLRVAERHMNAEALRGITPRAVYTMISSNWRGAHASEVAMLATSYPPTFFAMIIAANKDKSYRKTPIQSIMERTKKNIDVDQWTKSVKATMVAVREDWT